MGANTSSRSDASLLADDDGKYNIDIIKRSELTTVHSKRQRYCQVSRLSDTFYSP